MQFLVYLDNLNFFLGVGLQNLLIPKKNFLWQEKSFETNDYVVIGV